MNKTKHLILNPNGYILAVEYKVLTDKPWGPRFFLVNYRCIEFDVGLLA